MKFSACFLAVLVFALNSEGHTDEDHESNRLQVLKSQFGELKSDTLLEVKMFDERYVSELNSLKAKAQSNGNLDLVLAVQTEIDEFQTRIGTSRVSSFAELARLQDIYQRESGKIRLKAFHALKSLIGSYRAQLAELEVELTKGGSFNSAVEARKEAENIDNSELESLLVSLPRKDWPFPESDQEIEFFLKGTKWRFENGNIITFNRNETISKSWGHLNPKWEVKEGVIGFERREFRLDKGSGKLVLESEARDDIAGSGVFHE